MASKKGGLGKGLEALFLDNNPSESQDITTLNINDMEPNREQPRKDFDEESLLQLADSIREHGVIQPLIVRLTSSGVYQIVAGERRWRASRMVGLKELPVVIKNLTDTEAMELALIENLQREDLNAVEEALGYQTLMEQYEKTQEEVAKSVGKSRPAITNALRLLHLPAQVLTYLKTGQISAGHARALLAAEDETIIIQLAREIIKSGLSVRQTEKLVRNLSKRDENETKKKPMDAYYTQIQATLGESLGRKVRIAEGKNKGILEVEFYGKEDLESLVRILSHAEEE